MESYVDYAFYMQDYNGTIDESPFKNLSIEASRIVDSNVNKKLTETDIDDNLKFIVCKLIDLLNKKNNANDNQKVQSISIDGVSKTYKNVVMDNEEYEKQLNSILNYLPHNLTRYLWMMNFQD